ncbi:MAG: hypothetical protein ACSLFK_01790 [Gemmatimonadaceae bacterium]
MNMFLDPRALFMLVLLVGVTGWVLKGLMVTWHRLRTGDRKAGPQLGDMESRLRNVEEATTSLLMDVSSLREKQRFMTRLQAASASLETTGVPERAAGSDISPMSTQSIPVMPRMGKR